MVNIYPKFERNRILKKELLLALRDYSFFQTQMQYENYSTGIIQGLKMIPKDENTLTVGKGIIKFDDFVYILHEEQDVILDKRNKLVSFKAELIKDETIEDYIKYSVNFFLDENLNTEQNQVELCRFKLMDGFKLRNEHKNFYDLATEFDTVNHIHATWAGIGERTISPYILKFFANEVMQYDITDSRDITFVYFCLNSERLLERQIIQSYLIKKFNLKKDTSLSNEEIFKYLEMSIKNIKDNKKQDNQSNDDIDDMILMF